MVTNNAPNEIAALEKLVMLSTLAMNRSLRTEEIHRQLAYAKVMVPQRSGSDADERFSVHASALRQFLHGANTKETLGEELAKTQDILSRGGP